MSLAQLPPPTEPIIDDEKRPTLRWSVYFDELASGDYGTSFTPTFVGLTEVGTATITGIYYRISARLVYYRITITPGTNTSAVNGTTYCDNFPLRFTANSANTTISGFTAAVSGTDASTNRIYTASWTTITTPIVITGIGEVS
jgi:hypothetical protein